MIALIQNSEQPVTAVVFASGRGASAARFRALVLLVALITLYPATVLFGVKGLLIVGIVECGALRWILRRLAQRERQVPFQDQAGALGCVTIAVAMLYQHVVVPPPAGQIVAVTIGVAIIAGFGSRVLGQTFVALRALLIAQPGPRQIG